MNAKKVNWMFVAIFFMYHAVSYGLIYYITHIHMIGLIPLNMASELIFVIPGVIFVFATRTKWRDMLRLKPIRISTVLIVILFTFLCMPLITVVNAVFCGKRGGSEQHHVPADAIRRDVFYCGDLCARLRGDCIPRHYV